MMNRKKKDHFPFTKVESLKNGSRRTWNTFILISDHVAIAAFTSNCSGWQTIDNNTLLGRRARVPFKAWIDANTPVGTNLLRRTIFVN